jgi:hypothetical protein
MDAAAGKHREKWGCWWNRDIDAIVAQVRGGGEMLCGAGRAFEGSEGGRARACASGGGDGAEGGRSQWCRG